MTKETKIGLLVGLAFIIVVGILLSDHVANSSRDPQAVLTNVGNNVRDSVAIPAPGQPVVQANNAAPTAPVPTPQELQRQPIRTASVVVGIGPGGKVQSLEPSGVTPITLDSPSTIPLAATDEQPAPREPAAVAQTPTPAQEPTASAQPIKTAPSADQTTNSAKQYKVQRGDTLAQLAHKFYGTNSHAAVQAILAANPQLKGDATRLVAGRTYVIPEYHSTQNQPHLTQTPLAAHAKTAAKTSEIAGGTYTIKSGDTLWKIAAEKLGSGSDWKQIQKLNPTTIKGGALRVGQVIKLPARVVAAAD